MTTQITYDRSKVTLAGGAVRVVSVAAQGPAGPANAPIADQTVLGNVSGASAVPVALTAEQLREMLLPAAVEIDSDADVALGHCWGLLVVTAAATITLPADLPSGFRVAVVRDTWDEVAFVPASGATLSHPNNHDRPADRSSRVVLEIVRNDDDASAEWVLSGDTAGAGSILDFSDPDQSAFLAAF